MSELGYGESTKKLPLWVVHVWLLFTPSAMVKLWKKRKAYRLPYLPSNVFFSLPLPLLYYVHLVILVPNLNRQPWQKSGPITATRSENTQKLFGDRVCPAAKQFCCILSWRLCLKRCRGNLQFPSEPVRLFTLIAKMLCIHSPFK